MQLNRAEIETRLPHRAPILLLSAAQGLTPTQLTAVMDIAADSHWFNGHFPGQPTLPGVIMLEAMAQTAALHTALTEDLTHDQAIYYFLGAESLRFRKPVQGAARLELQVTLDNRKADFFRYIAKTLNGTDVIAEATLMAKLVRK